MTKEEFTNEVLRQQKKGNYLLRVYQNNSAFINDYNIKNYSKKDIETLYTIIDDFYTIDKIKCFKVGK